MNADHALENYRCVSGEVSPPVRKRRSTGHIAIRQIGISGAAMALLTGTAMVGFGPLSSLPAEAQPTILYASSSGAGAACTSSTPCSLTEALSSAISGDTVELFSGTYTGNFNVPSVTIEPLPGPSSPVVLNGGGVLGLSVIAIEAGVTATVEGLTFTNGDGAWGGGIYNDGTLTVERSTISGNTASGGSGRHYGGGIYNAGTLTVEGSTISGNSAPGDAGGGVFNDVGGSVTVESSTISNNTAGYAGGGIYNYAGDFTIDDSTISGNAAAVAVGGGIENGGGTLTAVSSTISNNTAGYTGGGIDSGGPSALGATILSGNSGGNCTGSTFSSLGHNLTDDSGANCGFNQPTDLVNASPHFGPLADNGGPTETLLPATLSPAIGVVPTGTTLNGFPVCPGTDQRGVARPQPSSGTACTIGAVEVAPGVAPIFTSAPSDSVIQGVASNFTVAATGTPTPSLFESGALPAGIAFADDGNGTATLSGTPAPGTAGSYPITVTASNGVSPDAAQTFTLTVLPIEIATTSLPSGTVRQTYSASLAAVGGNPPYKWKVITGSLPKGIALNKTTGVISGETKQAGTLNFTVEVLDTKTKRSKGHPPSHNTATQTLSITISP